MIGDSSKDNTRMKMSEFCARLQKVYAICCAKLIFVTTRHPKTEGRVAILSDDRRFLFVTVEIIVIYCKNCRSYFCLEHSISRIVNSATYTLYRNWN